MKNNTLVILDLSKNYDLSEKNIKFVSLNKGLINLDKCEQIYLKNFPQEKRDVYKKLLSKLSNIIFKNKNNPLIEFEVNNLRNDRYDFIDRIINLSIINKIILSTNFDTIKIISDNKNTLDKFDKLNIKIEKIDFSKKEKKVNFFRLKLLKFYLKALIITIFLRLRKKSFIQKKDVESYFSIIPNKFKYYKKDLDKELIINFLLTDETHLNHNLFEIFKVIKNQKFKNLINIESLISIKYLIFLIFKTLFLKIEYNFHLDDFRINGLSFKKEIKFFYFISYLNRSKLDIYNHAIKIFLKKFDIKTVHMYLFEYSFGFYFINKIRNFSKQIKINGYQHGIFSENLLWLDILRLTKNKKNYLPDKIIASNTYSAKDYKKKLRNISIEINKKNEIEKKVFVNEIKIRNNSKNIIIFPGTHDISDLYFFFRNLKNSDKKKFLFKLHPKNKFAFKNINCISTVTSHKIKDFSKIVISQTSSLIYDFLKMKKKFFVLDIDYKSDLLNRKILKKKRLFNRKKLHDKRITFKI